MKWPLYVLAFSGRCCGRGRRRIDCHHQRYHCTACHLYGVLVNHTHSIYNTYSKHHTKHTRNDSARSPSKYACSCVTTYSILLFSSVCLCVCLHWLAILLLYICITRSLLGKNAWPVWFSILIRISIQWKIINFGNSTHTVLNFILRRDYQQKAKQNKNK